MAELREDIQVSILPGVDLTQASIGDEFDVLVSVPPPKGDTRTPVNISCVLDVSGSMGAEATIQSASGQTESHGLSLLDVAKHGVKTVIMSLNENDYFSLITFNNWGEVVINLTQMTKENQKMACEKLDSFTHGGGTAIWQGLRAGLDTLKEVRPNSLSHVICLTDGETTDRDVLVAEIQKYAQDLSGESGRLPATISTFGFGYGVNSDLLVQVANIGSGTYSFIPDAGFVGTAFVNLMSYLVVTNAVGVFLDIAPEDNVEFCGSPAVMGWLPVTESTSQHRVSLGTLQIGQNRDVVVRMKVKEPIKSNDAYLTASVLYEETGGKQLQSGMAEGKAMSPVAPEAVQKFCENRARCDFVQTIRTVTQNLVASSAYSNEETVRQNSLLIPELATRTQAELTTAGSSEFLSALLEDITGQVAEALSKREYLTKWGRHYLPSLMLAHRLQMCNNFKDPGVQLYGGDLFKESQDLADQAFNDLPAPKPSRSANSYSSYSAPAVSMAAYNDRYAG